MKELCSSLADWWKEKTTSPFYGTFFMALVFWNWKIFYVLFFEDAAIIGEPKIKYVSENYLSFLSHFNFCLWKPLCVYPTINILDWIFMILFHLVPPFGIALLLIWIFPKFTNKLHNKSLDFHFERQSAFRNKTIEFEKEESKGLKEIKKEVEKQADTQKEISATKTKIKESKTPEQIWDGEFEKLKDNSLFSNFGKLKDCIYRNSGYCSESYKDVIPFFHVNEIVEYKKNKENTIELTEKGKYFMKKYLG
ncbi:MAG: hypothetical protein WCV72_02085 [Patescibacteria group bacterium]|jgi:hypothetical protein